MNYEAQYWKNEYEQLRRKKIKEINELKNMQIKFFNTTYCLLKKMGISDHEISQIYQKGKEYVSK